MRKIKKILIANRGEIAVRIIRACHELGIEAVSVFTDADKLAKHVKLADYAYYIGESPSSKSYLVAEKILNVAKESGADAIHPGYGFLSENGDFADLVREHGIIFIGPPASAMRSMGSKTSARELMIKAGVPVVPGTESGITNIEDAQVTALEIGYPVLIKAASGGGGKGMRVVQKPEDFEKLMRMAQNEAASSFGDSTVYIEKYLEKPRHIEFQILGDQHGNVVYLGERECSIQRRHQKVVEEALSAVLTPELRKKMGEMAVKSAKAVGYYNAGTIECLIDKHLNYYFLEMNTRLQVEHPITEMVTGIDLVKEQINIAEGGKLPFTQEEIKFNGHAIECRIYAEDCWNNFAPSIGKITKLIPADGFGIREDSGAYQGHEVSIYYDPMISKLVAWGKDRNEAIARMKRALNEYEIIGVNTTIPFCRFVMNHEAFVSGDFDTHFVPNFFTADKLNSNDESEIKTAIIGSAAAYELQSKKIVASFENSQSNWKIKQFTS
ncbi:acetyl-CoA carboxylase biotin carboxylase subunit [bacterium]|nr:acetyl-CoA carboxylase biotin carboxylase subunit [bacterium]